MFLKKFKSFRDEYCAIARRATFAPPVEAPAARLLGSTEWLVATARTHPMDAPQWSSWPAMSSRPALMPNNESESGIQGLHLHSLPSVVVFAAQASSDEVSTSSRRGSILRLIRLHQLH